MRSDDAEVITARGGLAGEAVATAGLLVVDVGALVYVAVRNRSNLNPDAVAYLQIARHIVDGRIDLAVNGYWGPLLSWLMAPFLAFGVDRLVTARVVLVISALLFLLGAMSLFRALRFRALTFAALSFLTAAASISWSVDAITPDLLAGGMLLFACSKTFSADWTESSALQVTSGLAWGIGYLAKAIVLPIGIFVTIAAGLVAAMAGQRRQALRATAVSLLLIALTSGPWITILSLKYRKPTFSTAGPIAHALIGPPDTDRRNPLVLGFRTPERERLIVSEDPTVIPFRYWSPFARRDYMRYQLEVCRRNLGVIVSRVEAFDRFHLGFWALVALAVILLLRPQLTLRYRWLLVPIPVAAALLLYMPVWANDARYYYFAYPLAAAAAAGAVSPLFRWPPAFVVSMAVVVLSFLFPIRDAVRVAASGTENRAVAVARLLTGRLVDLDRVGPVAGIGDVDGSMAGLYIAFFLDQPWVGDEPQLSTLDLRRSDATLYVRRRGDREVTAQIDRDGAFINLDPLLFSPEEASAFPIVVFTRAAGRTNGDRRGPYGPR
jgi:uncharacterized protein (DUF697 family)